LGHSKVKSIVQEAITSHLSSTTSYYITLTMKGLGVTLEFTLASHRVYSRALKMTNHEWHELAWHVDRNNLRR